MMRIARPEEIEFFDKIRHTSVAKSSEIKSYNIEPFWNAWEAYLVTAYKGQNYTKKIANPNSSLVGNTDTDVQKEKNRSQESLSAERLPLRSEQQYPIRKQLKPPSKIPKPSTPGAARQSRSIFPALTTPKSTPVRMSGSERGYQILPNRASIPKLKPEVDRGQGQGQPIIQSWAGQGAAMVREKYLSSQKPMEDFQSRSTDRTELVTPKRGNEVRKTFSGLSVSVVNAAPRMSINNELFMSGSGDDRRSSYASPYSKMSTPKAMSARCDSTRKSAPGDSGRWTSDGRVSRSRQKSTSSARDSTPRPKPRPLELNTISPPPLNDLSFEDLAGDFNRNCQVSDTPTPSHKLLRRSASSYQLTNRKSSLMSPASRKSNSVTCFTTENSLHSLEKPIEKLESDDWEDNIEGFRVLVNVVHENPESIRHNLARINNAGIKQLSNLRSQVCRAALHFFKELFAELGRAMEHDVDKLTEKLLEKSADTNRFIREDACAVLEAMVETLSPHRIIHTMEFIGTKHRNTLVRTTTARMTELLVRRLGAVRVLEEMADKVLPMLASFLQEGSLDTRMYAKEALAPLVCQPNFECLLRRHVCVELLKSVNKSIVSVRQDMTGQRSSILPTY